ncbi:hypothetical protein LTR53_018042, partial [Teratosphaeriaceae sp. CCFEE 6253]
DARKQAQATVNYEAESVPLRDSGERQDARDEEMDRRKSDDAHSRDSLSLVVDADVYGSRPQTNGQDDKRPAKHSLDVG